MNAMGIKLAEHPELVQRFVDLNQKRDEFDRWFDKMTNVGEKPLTPALRLQADKKNLELVKGYGLFADAIGIKTRIVSIKDVSGIGETSALEFLAIDHPYFKSLKKRENFTIFLDPLRSYLFGGVRGSVDSDSWDHTYLHLYDFPLLITHNPVHEILVHEMSHVKTRAAEKATGIFSDTGKLLAMGGTIEIQSSKRPIQYYLKHYNWDEINAYIVSMEELVAHLRMAKQLPKNLPSHYPLSLLFDKARLPNSMNTRVKILGEILDSAERILAQVQNQFLAHPTAFPEFDFDTGIESGKFYLSYGSRKDVSPKDRPDLVKEIRKNLETKKEILAVARKEMAELKLQWDQLQSPD